MFPSGNFLNSSQYQSNIIQGQSLSNSQIPQMQMYPTQMSQTPIFPTQEPQIQVYPSQSTNTQNLFPPNQEQYRQMHHQAQNNFQFSRMISTSEEEIETVNKEHSWQVVKSIKRRKTFNDKHTTDNNIISHNKYSPLATNDTEDTTSTRNEKIPKPPPIFIYGVVNFSSMVTKLRDVIEDEQYVTKSMADNTIKINTNTPESYRKLVKFLNENNIVHHTYQPKEERAYRVVIKHLHHSLNTNDIKEELQALGHKVRNIINAKHRQTKEPLNMFFVDLEPSENNKEIYQIRGLQNKTVVIEPPRRDNNIAQCTRCQMYGHTKTYCNRPYVCVKCGGSHNTSSCKKSKDTPASCALCGGPHPANYKGCEYYHRMYKNYKPPTQQQTQSATQSSEYRHTTNSQRQQPSYSETVKNSATQPTNKVNNSIDILSNFLEEFKNMFSQLMQQNSMVLNMLTMLINKLN